MHRGRDTVICAAGTVTNVTGYAAQGRCVMSLGSYGRLGGYLFIRLLDDVQGGRYVLCAPYLENDTSLF